MQFNTNKLYYHFLTDDCMLQDGTIAEVGKIEYAANQDTELELCSAACVHACENPVACFNYTRGLRISGVYFPDETTSDDDKTGAKMRYRVFILSPEVSKIIVWKFLKFCLEQAFEASRKAGYEPDSRSIAVVDILNRLIEEKEIPQDELDAAADAAAAAADAAAAAADAAADAARAAADAARAAADAAYAAYAAARAAARAAADAADAARAAARAAADAADAAAAAAYARAAQKEYLINLIDEARFKTH